MSDLSVKHQREEIKAKNEKLARTNLMILNNALQGVITAADPEYRQWRIEGYNRLLQLVHVNGVGGAKVTP